MPMTWDAAADAKLFTVVMAVYDIKISGAQNERIAKMMGEDCTPKAITHRLSKIRSQGGGVTPSSSTTTITPKSRKAHATKFSGTPSKSSKSKGKDLAGLSATHTRTTLMEDDGGDDEEDFSTPTHAPKGKKRKMEPKEEDEAEDLGDAIDFEVLNKAGKGKGAKFEEGPIDLTEHPGDDDLVVSGVKVKKEVEAFDGFDFDAEI